MSPQGPSLLNLAVGFVMIVFFVGGLIASLNRLIDRKRQRGFEVITKPDAGKGQEARKE